MREITLVTINNPMCGVTYKFNYPKVDFMIRFHNQLSAVGYFIDNTVDGNTLVINPSNCSFIEIEEGEDTHGTSK